MNKKEKEREESDLRISVYLPKKIGGKKRGRVPEQEARLKRIGLQLSI